MDQLLNEKDAAKRLGVSVQLLRKWRATRVGPVHMKLGRCVRYSLPDLERFADAQRIGQIKQDLTRSLLCT
jgi:predicted site-specific integrase-resolvase